MMNKIPNEQYIIDFVLIIYVVGVYEKYLCDLKSP